MTVNELRAKFLDFFKEKGHAVIPSASLLPENDPSVLFNSAGMQPLVPYLKGQPHPMGTRLADVQKCLRTGDIDEVGDNRHLTFFEMLGNWSLGDYFKPESIAWSYELLMSEKWLGIDPKKIYVSVFEGDDDAPRDEESIAIWQGQFEVNGIAAEIGVAGKDEPAQGDVGPRIYTYDKDKNWWPGATSKGLCGPDTEIFFDTGKPHDPAYGPVCHPNCDCGRFVEIWNNVFMQFNRVEEAGALEPLPSKNVDTGMGLERTAAIISGYSTVFDLPSFRVIISELESLSEKRYTKSTENRPYVETIGPYPASSDDRPLDINRSFRIIADHIRSAVFAISDGATPSNLKQGYVVRRLIRRAIREANRISINDAFCGKIANIVIGEFGEAYRELETKRETIVSEIEKEEAKFGQTVAKGLKELEKMMREGDLTGEKAFVLYSTYGFPLELTEEIVKERGGAIDKDAFRSEFEKHQELSRTASAGMFKGGLQDDSEESRKLHTATHLLHAALRDVLGEHVQQKGSNITPERLRFDFSHPDKMTKEQIAQVEDLVNEVIRKDLSVICRHMNVDEARTSGALGFFEEKYKNIEGDLSVYQVGEDGSVFSKEICGGPHVEHTGEIGPFKIKKEEASSAGIRRIKATVG
jgi:alanyl-tRNA synthetase